MKFLCTLVLQLVMTGCLFSQVTFTQTTNDDFLKGSLNNVLVSNDQVSVPAKATAISDWYATTNLPATLSGHQIVTWRNYAYLTGGFDGTNYSAAVYRTTVNTGGIGSWTTLTALPLSLKNHAVVTGHNMIYVLGGKNANTISDKIYYASLDPASGNIGTWQLSTVTLPYPLWGHKAQYINGYLYVTGGSDQAGNTTAKNEVLVCQIDAEGGLSAITATTSLPESRNGHTMVTYDNQIFILGGFANGGTKQKTVYYAGINNDGSIGNWLSASPLPTPVSNHVSTCSNGIITVIGGADTTEIGITDKFYFADIAAWPVLAWTDSYKNLIDRTKDAQAYVSDGQILYAGGTNLSSANVSANRYVPLQLGAQKMNRTSFVSARFFIGAIKTIQQLEYSLSYSTGDSYEILYRVAGPNKIWGSWNSRGQNNPAILNEEMSYLQYMIRFTANSTQSISLNDLTMRISGYTQLSGNLNSMNTLSLSASPYWATGDIQFTSGSHTIEAGVKIVFSPNTGLDIGAASVSFNGTALNPVTLSYYDSLQGQWRGVLFNSASNPNASQMNYTIIEKAGQGTNNANLYCQSTAQPTISNCIFRHCDGHGLRLESANLNISSTSILNNTESGLFLQSANPVLNTVNISYNGYAGIYYNTAGITPSFTNCLVHHNIYGIYSPTPDNSFAPATPTSVVLNNNSNAIAIGTNVGSNITAARNWKYFPDGYAILGSISVIQTSTVPRLTIAPGTKVKVAKNANIIIGQTNGSGGELSAVGKPDSLITFTALNDSTGGWMGLDFRNGADNGSISSLQYCIVEKGKDYNIQVTDAQMPAIKYSIIRNTQGSGIRLLSNSGITIEETTIKNNLLNGIYCDNSNPVIAYCIIDSCLNAGICLNGTTLVPTIFSTTIKNTNYGTYVPYLTGITSNLLTALRNINFLNVYASVASLGATFTSDFKLYAFKYPYYLLDHIYVYKGNDKARLTLAPGVTLKFAQGKLLQIGANNNNGGELFAIGKVDSLITFSSINGQKGGWDGIYFNQWADNYSNSNSILRNCVIENGNQRNIWIEHDSHTKIDSCKIRFAKQFGLLTTGDQTNDSITNCFFDNNDSIGANCQTLTSFYNCRFSNNGDYGLYFSDSHWCRYLNKLSWANNGSHNLVINGGSIQVNTLWHAVNTDYCILGTITVYKYNDKVRLTIAPGVSIKFASGKKLQIGTVSGYYSDQYYGGELFAIGKADSLINFSSLNGIKGGWEGIYISQWADNYNNAASVLRNCIIEKGNDKCLWIEHDSHTSIDSCVIRRAKKYGLYTSGDQSNCTISNSLITENDSIGANCQGAITNFYKCSFTNNGDYGLYFSDSYYCKSLSNLSWGNNGLYNLVINGGSIQVNTTWNAVGTDYCILGTITVYKYNDKVRLTIEPGVSLKFALGKKLQIGTVGGYYGDQYYGGELYAIGKADSLIKFSSINGIKGGWDGIYISQFADNYGGVNCLKNCILEDGNDRNIWVEHDSHTSIDSCIIRKAKKFGLLTTGDQTNCTITNCLFDDNDSIGANCQAITSFNNCQFINNGDYGLYFSDSHWCRNLNKLNWANNGNHNLVINGGSIQVNTTWNAVGTDYCILESITVYKYNDKVRLTIEPGVSLKFALGKKLQIGTVGGYYGDQYYGGELYAIGRADSLIKFSSINGIKGGWDGIYISQFADNYGGINCLKNCILEDGNDRNLWVEHDSHTSIDSCIIRKAKKFGLLTTGDQTNCTITNCIFDDNDSIGANCQAITSFNYCQFINNGDYGLYFSDSHWCQNLNKLNWANNGNRNLVINGGSIQVNTTWNAVGTDYCILESITVYKYNNKVRLTIEPGVSLKFALGKKLQIGMVGGYYGDQYYGGELFAIGKPDSLITFSAINNSKGGWDGIYIHHAADNYGGISCLKNCLIENGNDRNVYIESDTHTTIDSCIIRNALSRGVYISNSNPKICRTSIYENTNGIYIDGNSNPRIGNYPDSANNIFNNSLYNIYNNSGNNLNMKYNYFGLVDTLNINRKIYDKNDNAGLGLISYKPYNNLPKLITPTMHSQGYLSYGKPTFSAMKSDKVEVKDNSLTVVATATTNSSGVFTHSNISSGSYNMVFTPLNETYSSVNSADALKILRHFSHLDTLKTHYAQVADVNANKVINATDAMLVLRRFAGSITSFVTGDTWFYSDTSIVSGNDVESRVRMLWFGDVNASYNPAAKMTTPPLNPRGSLDISRTQEFDYPLYLDTREILGSISLVLRYPGQHLEVSDVQFGREDGMSTYTIQKDEIRFAWASLEPLEVQKDIPFLTIRFKVKNLPKGMVPEITLGEETSFSDKRAENLADLVVAAPELRSVSPDQSLQKDQGIRIHRLTQTEGSTLIEFNSSSTGRAVFNLYNVLGQLVLSEYLEIAEGTNLKPFQTSQLEKGIYLLNISYDAASGIDNQNLKLYISK